MEEEWPRRHLKDTHCEDTSGKAGGSHCDANVPALPLGQGPCAQGEGSCLPEGELTAS